MLMSDELLSLDTRVDAALSAMREPPADARDVSARIAARAVLANEPIARATTFTLRAAAVITVLALGSAAIATTRIRSTGTLIASAPGAIVVEVPAPVRSALVPVIATRSRPIVFELDAPDASTVQVLGDFNQWSRDVSSMERGADGRWRMTTLLPPGRYVYAFLVDGQTFRRDPLRDAIEDRDFGVTGSELVVGEAP
jgi:Glycogen recognition site of AMP-activated protein kinase